MVGGTFVFLSHRLGGDLLFGLGRQGQVAVLELTEAVGIFGLTIPLSLKFGIVGAGLGLAIPPIFVRGLLQTRFVCQALKLSLLEYYSKCIMRSWLVVAVMGALTKLVDWPSVINGWPSLVAASAMLLLGYATLVFFVVLDAGERDRFRKESFRLISRLGFLFGD